MSTTVKEYIRKKALGLIGLIDSDTDPRVRDERLTFVNDIDEIRADKIKEYNVWYSGEADELLNFYTRASTIDYNTDPLFNRNKKSYFWSVSATETDIKRSHSGQPRNIVDTLVNIVGIPKAGVGEREGALSPVDKLLRDILDDNGFDRQLIQRARPLTLVEGWGAWKINWDLSISDYPILSYYRADAVDFIYRCNRLIAIVYRDYYQDEKKQNYVLFETRRVDYIVPPKSETDEKCRCLIIEKELFKLSNDSKSMVSVKLNSLPQLKDVRTCIVIDHYDRFLGAPSIYFEDSTGDCYGRSLFTGKIDLFDDEDQCHSQAANAVRRSTVHEYMDSLYLEKDEHTGMPIMPKAFDRKYIMYRGRKSGDGIMGGSGPVQVTQPNVDFLSYSTEEQNILVNIISGIMSPATLGIDIAKKDNAEAQREKEKVTIFTRNTIIAEEQKNLKALFVDLLCAYQMMHSGKITCRDYSVYVQYDEFADASFEAKLETVVGAWGQGIMSDDMAIEYLYGDTVSPEVRDRELKFLQQARSDAQAAQMGQAPGAQGDIGALLGGDNGYDEAVEGMPADALSGTDGTGGML